MQKHSRPRYYLLALFLLLTASSAAVGVFASKAHATGGATAAAVEPAKPKLLVGFPDASVLQERFLAGELEGTHALTVEEVVSLQVEIDQLNLLWHSTITQLHRRMEVVVDAMIDRGEIAPSHNGRFVPPDGAVGCRVTVRDDLVYRKDFASGDDARVDELEHRRQLLNDLGQAVIRAAFQ